MAYVLVSNAGDTSLTITDLEADSAVHVRGGLAPQFSEDGAWIGFRVAGGRAEIRELATGHRREFSNVDSLVFGPGSRAVVLRAARPANGSAHGSTLLVHDLLARVDQPFGSVREFAFDSSGTLLAFTVDATDSLGNGVYLHSLATRVTTPLITDAQRYRGLAWHSARRGLAILRSLTGPNGEPNNTLLVWLASGTPSQRLIEYDPTTQPGVPAGFVLSDLASPRFSPDGLRVYVGLKEHEAPPARDAEPRANVDVWHWKDDDIQTRQKVLLPQERRATYTAVLSLTSRTLLALGDSVIRTVIPAPRGKWAVGAVDTAYAGAVDWFTFTMLHDYFRVDQETGARRLIDRRVNQTMGFSPNGRWWVYARDGKVRAHDLHAGQSTTLDSLADYFDVDRGSDPSPVHGLAGWSRDGRHAVLYGRLDVFAVPLDGGSAVSLTAGAAEREQIQFRLAWEDGSQDEPREIDLTKPLVLRAYGEWTKQSGYFLRRPNGRLIPLLYLDKRLGDEQRARRANRVIFTQQSATEFPDYWLSDTAFSAPRKVTNANPFFPEYAWSPKRVLVEYRNRAGRRLQGTLTLPAGFEQGRRYPMIVHPYELVSNRHHDFTAPLYTDRFHVSTYASQGYLVLQPDVVYEIGAPGSSALDCITAAVAQVIALGYADPQRIGLQGHSWGGYQASYIVTQTDMFAATVAGAPMTNTVSIYNAIFGSLGLVNQGFMEVGQGRMGRNVTPWNAHERYESQSPVHQAPGITTPLLIMHGTADRSVDPHQAVEFFNTARRLGKEAILLSYPDEGHHLHRRENQLDFQRRMQQFFDHHLRGAPAPAWMRDGVPQARKGGPPQ